MEETPTLFLVDDDPSVLDSLRTLAQTLGLQSETYPGAEEFLAEFREDQHGCLIVDVRMAGMTGLELQAQLVAAGHSIPVIVITGHGDIAMSVQAMKAGAVTMLEKPFEVNELVTAIRQALAEDGKRRNEQKHIAAFESKMNKLTDDERQVLDLVARGKTSQAIASTMDVSLRTIQFRKAAIWQKLGVDSRESLMQFLIDGNLQMPAKG
jgi:two-component system, LuxR family, response regulator FixJ